MQPEPNTPPLTDRPASILALAVWVGLVAGFAEVAMVGLQLLGPGYIGRSRDAAWMIPAFDATLFAMLGVGLILIGRVVHLGWRIAAGFFAAVGTLLVLLLVPGLHPLASAVAAAGVGTQTVRLLSSRLPAAARLVRRSLPWLALTVGVVAVVTVGWRLASERRLMGSRPAANRGAPNVLLLILDTVRAADMSLYGYARRTTPELERFAERGTVFDQTFSVASWTTPSHASMFTGLPALDLEVDWRAGLDKRWPTLAEILRARGYATAGFVANQVYAGWESGLARGFEHFEDYPLSVWSAMKATAFGKVIYPVLRRRWVRASRRVPLMWRLRFPASNERPSARHICDAFLGWVDRTRPAPFLAFLNFMDAHTPYTVPDSFRHRFSSVLLRTLRAEAWADAPAERLTPADVRPKRDVYDGSIAYLDSQLGRLFRELERRGLLDNTLVIVVSDHGDEFAEHGLVNHGYSLYRHSLGVPLLLRFPKRVPEGRRVSASVSLRNLAATVLDLLSPGERPVLPGRSLARFWARQDAAADTIVASISQMPNQPIWYPASRGDLNSIAFDGWRYIRNEGDGAEELYDFKHDLLERWNLVGTAEGDRLVPRYRAALGALIRDSEPHLAGNSDMPRSKRGI